MGDGIQWYSLKYSNTCNATDNTPYINKNPLRCDLRYRHGSYYIAAVSPQETKTYRAGKSFLLPVVLPHTPLVLEIVAVELPALSIDELLAVYSALAPRDDLVPRHINGCLGCPGGLLSGRPSA